MVRKTGDLSCSNPFRFSIKYQDDETGLLYYGYRYYNASTGKWQNRDLIGEEGGVNVYGVGNSLVTGVDLLGMRITCRCPETYFAENGIDSTMFKRTGETYSAKPGAPGPTQGAGLILWRMLMTSQDFKARGAKVENLKKHIEARQVIVSNARAAKFSWRDEGTKVLNPTGPHSEEILKNPTAFFGKDPLAFFQAINNSGTKLGCKAATLYVFESGNLNQGTGVRPNDLVFIPGDWPYLDNAAQTADPSDWDPGFEGENLIYVGGEEFWGHPAGVLSETAWRSRISNLDNSGEWKSRSGKPGIPIWGSHTDKGPPISKFPGIGLELPGHSY